MSGNIEENCSWYQYIFLTYFNPILSTGYYRPIEISDLGEVHSYDNCKLLSQKFEVNWSSELRKSPKLRSLWMTLLKTCGVTNFINAMLLFAVSAALQFGPVLILTKLVLFMEGRLSLTQNIMWSYVSLLGLLPALSTVALAHSNIILAHLGARCRNTLITAIYRKSFSISLSTRLQISSGKIFTMFSDDTNQIRNFLFFSNNTVLAPFQIIASLYLIYTEVGNGVFASAAYIIAILPLIFIVFYAINSMRKEKLVLTDARVKLLGEILHGIRAIKYFAWEKAFFSKIDTIRSHELNYLFSMGILYNSVFALLLIGGPSIQIILVLWVYLDVMDQPMELAKSFTVLTLFGLLTSPCVFLPVGLQQYSQALISCLRIQTFLELEDHKNYVLYHCEKSNSNMHENDNSPLLKGKDIYSIIFNNATFSWNNSNKYVLTNIKLNIEEGSFNGIIGGVAAGKTAFLLSLLSELYLIRGKVSIRKGLTISYCSQNPWLINDTLERNILFGLPLDEQKLSYILFVCSLTEDIKQFPMGVYTEIGERGYNLSGGQKARVALARALYRDADIYLLDDIFAAVDVHVGNHIFQHLSKRLLHGKTVLLVTGQPYIIQQVGNVLLIEHKTVRYYGSLEKFGLMTNEFAQYVPKRNDLSESSKTEADSDSTLQYTGDLTYMYPSNELISAPTKLITTEEIFVGRINWNIRFLYLHSGGLTKFCASLGMQLLRQAAVILGSFWLGNWPTHYNQRTIKVMGFTMKQSNTTFLSVFAGFQAVVVVSNVIAVTLMVYHRTQASKILHHSLLLTILSSPISFFDITPVGRIINRFSQDTANLDEMLPQVFNQFINMASSSIGDILAIVASTKGTFLVIIVPLAGIFAYLDDYYNMTNVAIARIESVTRSPIYAEFAENLAGAVTIRSFDRVKVSQSHQETLTNTNSIPGVYQLLIGQWLGIRLDFLAAIISFFVGLIAVISYINNVKLISAGFLAIGLSYSIQLTSVLKMTVRVFSNTEVQFNSVNRFNSYIELSHKDGGPTTNRTEFDPSVSNAQSVQLYSEWPRKGCIQFSNVEMSYRSGPSILKNVSFIIPPGKRIGVTGRSGSGKSSLFAAIMRFEELSSGFILIDGVDIKGIPVTVLRSKISVIPQETVIFSDTIRHNIDPFSIHHDSEIWRCLDDVGLSEFVHRQPNKLDEHIEEGGGNLSAGQKQLLCFTRALLNKSQIYLMDEATSALDRHSDFLIHNLVKTKFQGSTIIIIAHRLQTILNCDYIITMDNGKIKEFGSPQDLLAENTLFKKLCKTYR